MRFSAEYSGEIFKLAGKEELDSFIASPEVSKGGCISFILHSVWCGRAWACACVSVGDWWIRVDAGTIHVSSFHFALVADVRANVDLWI